MECAFCKGFGCVDYDFSVMCQHSGGVLSLCFTELFPPEKALTGT